MQQNFNVRNFEKSRGMLREIPFDAVEFLQVTGSHTIAAIKIIEGRVRPAITQPIMETVNGGREFHALSLDGSWRKHALICLPS